MAACGWGIMVVPLLPHGAPRLPRMASILQVYMIRWSEEIPAATTLIDRHPSVIGVAGIGPYKYTTYTRQQATGSWSI